ncbi:hypothetical protein ACP70R_041757 [Stipagrostis hirtigluma subsp. patula]
MAFIRARRREPRPPPPLPSPLPAAGPPSTTAAAASTLFHEHQPTSSTPHTSSLPHHRLRMGVVLHVQGSMLLFLLVTLCIDSGETETLPGTTIFYFEYMENPNGGLQIRNVLDSLIRRSSSPLITGARATSRPKVQSQEDDQMKMEGIIFECYDQKLNRHMHTQAPDSSVYASNEAKLHPTKEMSTGRSALLLLLPPPATWNKNGRSMSN